MIPFDPDTMQITHAYPVNGDTTNYFWSWIFLHVTFRSVSLPPTEARSVWETGARMDYVFAFDYSNGALMVQRELKLVNSPP